MWTICVSGHTLCFWGTMPDIHNTRSYHQGIIFSYSWISGRPWEIQTNGIVYRRRGGGGKGKKQRREGGGKERRKKERTEVNHLKYSVNFSLEKSCLFFWQSKNISSFRSFPSWSHCLFSAPFCYHNILFKLL